MSETDALEPEGRLTETPSDLASTSDQETQMHGTQSLVVEPDAPYSTTSISLHYQDSSNKNSSQEIHDPFQQESTSPASHTERFVVSPNNEHDDLSTSPSLSNDSTSKQGTKEVPKRPTPEETHLRDIIGHEEVKQRIAELTLPLLLPESILQSVFKGIRRLPATILLHGPPGCGKTKLARAIAGEAEAALIQVAPSNVLSKFVGESESFIQKLFCAAIEKGAVLESRCAVIFFDEIDALGRDRENSGAGEGEACSRRVLTELLLQMNIVLSQRLCTLRDFQGHDENIDTNVLADRKVRIVIAAATNRPGDCDSALLRRFELTLEVGLPSPSDRLLMIAKHLDEIDNDLTPGEFNLLAAFTADWSGAAIETLCRDAVQAPVRDCIQRAILIRKRAEAEELSSEGSKGEEDCSKDAYNALLTGITSLRPVSLMDFQNSIEHMTGQLMPDGLPPSPKRIRTDGPIAVDIDHCERSTETEQY